VATPGGNIVATAELLGVTERLWCRPCARRSGMRVFFTMVLLATGEQTVSQIDVCQVCHGTEVDPPS
jgi:hypothetical protein